MKKRLLLFAVIFLIGFVFFRGNQNVSSEKIAKNLEYGVLKLKDQTAELHYVRFSLEDYQLRTIQAKDFKKLSLSSQEMLQASHALAVINANFFDENRKALGLIIDQKKIKNPLHPSSWWASFLIAGKNARIVLKPDPKELKKYDFAIQAGPRLVVAGKVPKLKSHISAKSAIGIDDQGKIVIIASKGHLDIRDFARYLSLSKKSGGLALKNALNLDGGSSTQFSIKSGDFQLEIPSFIKVPVGIGVFPR
ncbi:MAG: phosphodiester glycosidase family protein [Deltaproteobacteria bacterium]|nr:phosphodiester glycosidase family protein [Deltaproteobacteria bacterium]